MKYHISLTLRYKEELKFLQELFAKELDNNRTCIIETSDDINPYNVPKNVDFVFKINDLEFGRITYESYGKVDNHIHYESKEVEVARYIDDIMLKLPTIFND